MPKKIYFDTSSLRVLCGEWIARICLLRLRSNTLISSHSLSLTRTHPRGLLRFKTSSGLLTSNLGDLSLKDGAKIVVNSKLIKKSSPNLADKSVAKAKGGTGGIMLAPPPPPGSTVFAKVSSPSEPASEAAVGDDDGCADDEFGDFETA